METDLPNQPLRLTNGGVVRNRLKRVARGRDPRPDEDGLSAFLKSPLNSGWGTFRTRRLRARN
ncbi:hypothetical protein [Cupriavidus sp. YAF13]|uniref:hypothetical protein n=1 Tax=Cupriavidus sp. YAF13 TaxID=3233075 RepID=UPI003F937D70